MYLKRRIDLLQIMNNTNMVQIDVGCIKDGMQAFFSVDKSKKKYIPVTIKFLEYDSTLKDQRIVLIGKNGETIKKDTGEDKVFYLSKATKVKSLVFDENLIRQENEKLYRLKDFFEKDVKINGQPFYLDEEQLNAVLSKSDTQIIARAGSGKTRVLTAKLVDLFYNQKLTQDEAKAFCFNRDAKDELAKRINLQCSINNEYLFRSYDVVNTFHSFAKRYSGVVGQIIGDEKTKLIKLVINYLCDTNDKFKKILGEFFLADTLKIDRKKFSSAEAYYEYLRNCRYETLNGEKVKSIDEMYIADFLFEHDINYIYENRYYLNNIIPGDNVLLENYIKETKEIAPDFYLTDYDLIWEHWAITDKTPESEKTSFTKRVGDASVYLHNRANKQKFWNDWRFNCKYRCYEDRFLRVKKLLETCHKEFIDANPDDKETLCRLEIEKVLKSFLEKYGVKCVKLPREEIVRRVFEKAKDRFSTMMEQFVNKYQQTFFEREDEFIHLADMVENPKEKAFLRLGYLVYREYVSAINNTNNIERLSEFDKYTMDFNQCLSIATNRIKSGECDEIVKKYKWILIDEYQDFSRLFYELIVSIKSRNPSLKVFCVGDNCQAINRFAGSDPIYFDEFDKYFTDSSKYYITTTYRSDSNIVSKANAFMNRIPNAGADSKGLSKEQGVFEWHYINEVFMNPYEPLYRKLFDGEECIWHTSMATSSKVEAARYVQKIFEIIKKLPEDEEILILSRTNLFYDKTTDQFRRIIEKICERKIEVKTIHKSKGEEANAVIVIQADEGNIPMLHPDVCLFQVFGEDEKTQMIDEMKLFYVAITRAKNQLHILCDEDSKSSFA